MVACLAVALALGVPAGALASSSGEITRALVSPDWKTATIAGSAIRENVCPERIEGPKPPPEPPEKEPTDDPTIIHVKGPGYPPGECGWIAFATVGPGSSSTDCASPARRWGSFGDDVRLVWSSAELKTSGESSFDLEVGLQSGSSAPLLCLAAVEAFLKQEKCDKFLPCSWVLSHRTYELDSAPLGVVAPLALPLAPPPSPATPCRKAKKRPVRSQRKAGIGIGAATVVSGKAKRVRRCKTG